MPLCIAAADHKHHSARHVDGSQHRGWTLLEALVTIAMAAILAGYALPGMVKLSQAYTAHTITTDLRAAINLARFTAINKRSYVVMCPRAGSRCGPRNSWHLGALIFADNNHNRRYDANDVVVGHMAPISQGRIQWRAFRNRGYLLFTPRGLTDWQNGHFQYCPESQNAIYARQLVLNYAGRVYASADRNGDGVHEDARGRALQCD